MTPRQLTPDQMRARIAKLETENDSLRWKVIDQRKALQQQTRHIAQLVRALEPAPSPRRRRVAA